MSNDHQGSGGGKLRSPNPVAAGRPAASRADDAGSTGQADLPTAGKDDARDQETDEGYDAAGPAPDGITSDSFEPGIQAAGSREEAADAARQAARAVGGQADRLFTGSPGEEGPAPNVPSSLNMDSRGSAARTGRAEMRERRREHTETSPAVTAGDVDADWAAGYAVGDETPGGDNPTPGQTVVEDVGRALGVEYEDSEELKGAEKIESRDRHRWELDPASSEDYEERNKDRNGQG
jgi:hypothetical protein